MPISRRGGYCIYLESKLKFYSKAMKRASEIIGSYKRESWRKSPSAVFNIQIDPPSKYLPYSSTSLASPIATAICELIIQIVEGQIDRMEAINFIQSIHRNTSNLQTYISNAMHPSVENIHLAVNCPQEEPEHVLADLVCSTDKPIQKKSSKRQLISISTFTSPLKELRHKQKVSVSTKDLHLGHKRSIRSGLVPLNFTTCQQDSRASLIQTFYRQKFAKEEMNQEQSLLKPETRLFRKVNQRDKEQYAFDYDGQKIPIISSNPTKNNPLKILKTVYKVHKDKADLRQVKKINENIRAEKYSLIAAGSPFPDNGTDLPELKKGIQQGIKWTGKLNSIKILSEIEEVK